MHLGGRGGSPDPEDPCKKQYFLNVFIFVFCNCWLPVVTGDIPAPLLHKNENNAATACTFSKHLILIDFCNFWLSVVIGALLASSLHQHELNASTACSFCKTLDFDGSCENSAFRRDWRSSTYLLESLGAHVSDPGWPKWLPQAPFKATKNNSAYRRDWRSPGAPIISK